MAVGEVSSQSSSGLAVDGRVLLGQIWFPVSGQAEVTGDASRRGHLGQIVLVGVNWPSKGELPTELSPPRLVVHLAGRLKLIPCLHLTLSPYHH